MSDGTRAEATPLSRTIFEEGYHLEFFQAVHLLQNWHADGVRIGELGPPSKERLRLCPDDTLRFSPADIRRIEPPEADSKTARMVVNFMGLYGVSAPTPVYLTELIAFAGDDAAPLVDFLDIFNHRLLSLYYRAWLKYRFPYRYEAGAKDAFSSYVFSFVGLGDPLTHPLTELPVPRLLKYVGLGAPQTRPPISLQRLLVDYFDGLPDGGLLRHRDRLTNHQRTDFHGAFLSVIDTAGIFRVHSQMVDFGSVQGRSVFVTAGVAALRRGLQRRENAGMGQKMPFMDGH